MIKIYSNSLIKTIQNTINSGKAKVEAYKEYNEFFGYISSMQLLMQARQYPDGKRESILNIQNSDISTAFIKEWKQTATGKFLPKDFKKDNKDFLGNTLYHKLTLTLNNIPVRILIRLLNEVSDETISEADKQEYIKLYGDITIDGKYFSIIKIEDIDKYDGWSSRDKWRNLDISISDTTYESNVYIEETQDFDDDSNDIDDNSSEPLF